MKKERKKDLLQAIASRDKVKIREALSSTLPDLWMTVEIDHNERTIRYKGKLVTEEEMKEMIEEASQKNRVRLIVMNHDRREGELEDTWTMYEHEIIMDFKEVNVAYGDRKRAGERQNE